jgi:hypothetical protein
VVRDRAPHFGDAPARDRAPNSRDRAPAAGDRAPNSRDRAPSNLPDLKDLLTANDGSMIFFVQYCGLPDCCGRRNLSSELFYTTWDQDFYALTYLVNI